MIVFDLKCSDGGHVFEAWFGSSGDYEDQKARGFVTCPICGSVEVGKAVMSPSVGAKGNRSERPKEDGGAAVPVAHQPGDANAKSMLAALAEAQARALKASEYVGQRFADEARAMHTGERDERAIHGEATLKDARSLIEEGVPVSPLPLPVRPPNTDN